MVTHLNLGLSILYFAVICTFIQINFSVYIDFKIDNIFPISLLKRVRILHFHSRTDEVSMKTAVSREQKFNTVPYSRVIFEKLMVV